jgi:hypothetical protein
MAEARKNAEAGVLLRCEPYFPKIGLDGGDLIVPSPVDNEDRQGQGLGRRDGIETCERPSIMRRKAEGQGAAAWIVRPLARPEGLHPRYGILEFLERRALFRAQDSVEEGEIMHLVINEVLEWTGLGCKEDYAGKGQPRVLTRSAILGPSIAPSECPTRNSLP